MQAKDKGGEVRTAPPFRATCLGLLRSIDNLPSLPPLLWELQAVIQNPRSDAAEIAYVIERDVGLAARVLRVANSAWSGSASHINDVKEAVARIGIRALERVAASTLVFDAFAGFGHASGAKAFWKHSNRVAFIARVIAENNPSSTALMPEAAYATGLLHDVGKLVLHHYFPAEYACVEVWKREHGGNDAEAERAMLAIDHGEVGGELLELWNLPDEFVHGVRYHHDVDALPLPEQSTSALIRYADGFAHAFEEGVVEETDTADPRFQLTAKVTERLYKDLVREEELVDLMID